MLAQLKAMRRHRSEQHGAMEVLLLFAPHHVGAPKGSGEGYFPIRARDEKKCLASVVSLTCVDPRDDCRLVGTG